MSYCRFCGVELTYKRTKNDKWMPCNALTGEPHFCQEKKNATEKAPVDTGLMPCPTCGKPVFKQKNGRTNLLYDYTTLTEHKCKAADVTRFRKFNERQKKLNPVTKKYPTKETLLKTAINKNTGKKNIKTTGNKRKTNTTKKKTTKK